MILKIVYGFGTIQGEANMQNTKQIKELFMVEKLAAKLIAVYCPVFRYFNHENKVITADAYKAFVDQELLPIIKFGAEDGI